MKRQITSITRAALLTGLGACLFGELTLDVFAPPPGAGQGKASAVKITILDQPGDRITSDGKGLYIHGVDRVTAVIHDSGQLELDTGASTKPKRKVALDYSDILFGTACHRPGDTEIEVPDLDCDGQPGPLVYALLTEVRIFTLDLNLLNMVRGETRLGGLGVNFDDDCPAATHVPWRIRFQHQALDSVYSCGSTCSAQVIVKAFDAVPGKGITGTGVDTWIIMAELSAGAGAEACFWSGGTGEAVLREIVRMPFHLLVELQ